jgi:predicted NBD/HSP70 family sugar kinase
MAKPKAAVKIADQWLRQVLLLLYQKRHLTRIEIAELTGLNQASVSHALTHLLNRGLLLKTGEMQSEGRRRREIFDLNAEAGYFIGVDLEGDRIRFALTNFVGDIRCRWESPLEFRQPLDPATVIEGIRRVSRDVDASGPRRILAMGVSYPGMLDAKGNLVAVNLGWAGCGLVESLTNAFPAWPLFLESDKDTCILAETSRGSLEYRNALFLIAEGGIGLGILVDGRLVRGMRGLTGEIGHWKVLPDADDVCNCGARGCLEAIASSPNIVRQYVEADGNRESPRPVRVTDVFEKARHGNAAARAVLERAGRALGLALSHAISLLNPEIVILGGDLIAAEDTLVPVIRDEIARRTLPASSERLVVHVSSLGLDIRLRGAVLLAFRSILQNAALFKLLGTMSPPREKPTVFPAAQDAAAR